MTARRQRVRLCWIAQWEGPIEKWAKSYIWQNLWRCDAVHGTEDLLQDSFLIFLKLAERYPRVVDPPHFMSLFKRSITNMIHDHARRMVKKKRVFDLSYDEELAHSIIGEPTNGGYLSALLAEAPEELKLALAIMDEKPEVVRANGPYRENLNMRLRRALDNGTEFDFVGSLRTLLS